MVQMALCDNTGKGHKHRPQLWWDQGPDMTSSCILGLDVTMALGGGIDVSD